MALRADFRAKIRASFWAEQIPLPSRCKRSGECLPLDFICDGQPDCSDGSDEEGEGLCAAPVAVRLAGGNGATSGRVEVRFKVRTAQRR